LAQVRVQFVRISAPPHPLIGMLCSVDIDDLFADKSDYRGAPYVRSTTKERRKMCRARNDDFMKMAFDLSEMTKLSTETNTNSIFTEAGDENNDKDFGYDYVHDYPDQISRQASSGSVTSLSKFVRPAENCLIIVDFDDTLFPTAALATRSWFRDWSQGTDANPHIPEKDKTMLQEFDRSARAMITECSGLGTLTCITLAARPWVSQCMHAFLPQLAEVFEQHQVKVHYAREQMSVRWALPLHWDSCAPEERDALVSDICVRKKTKAMETAFKACYRQGSWTNVVSIGDGPAERCALQDIGISHRLTTGEQEPFRVKTIKLLEHPTCDQLMSELAVLRSWIFPIVAADKDIDAELDAGVDGLQRLKLLIGDLVTMCRPQPSKKDEEVDTPSRHGRSGWFTEGGRQMGA